ncbi:ribonuclease H-like domain-containing protein [Tanacetum coccineum]
MTDKTSFFFSPTINSNEISLHQEGEYDFWNGIKIRDNNLPPDHNLWDIIWSMEISKKRLHQQENILMLNLSGLAIQIKVWGNVKSKSAEGCFKISVWKTFSNEPNEKYDKAYDRVQRFIQKTRRNLDFKGKQLVTFDKSKGECCNCHRKGHFAKECKSGRNQWKKSYGDNGRRNATTNEPSSQALVAQDGLGGYDWSNNFDEPVNYVLMVISFSSSSSSSYKEVQKCSKQCLESFKTLQKNFDSEREKHSRARLEIQGYELTLESLESRILRHEKNELAWG